MNSWIVLIVVIIIIGIGYYAYSSPGGFSGVLSSISSTFSPSIQQIEANVSNYLGKQVTLNGGLGSNSKLFPYALDDYQGYSIGLQPNIRNQTLFPSANYSVTGTVAEFTVCTCPTGSYYNTNEDLATDFSVPKIINSANSTPQCYWQVENPNESSSLCTGGIRPLTTNQSVTCQPVFYKPFACPLSTVVYLNATKFVRT